MISYLAPEPREAISGGNRKLFDHVGILMAAGFEAEVVEAPLSPNLRIEAEPTDLLVIPEVYGDLLKTLAPGVPRISINQNAHNTFWNVADLNDHPYNDNPDLLAVLTVSEHNRQMIEFAFPSMRIERFFTSVGRPEDFYCGPFPRAKRICFFTRKKPDRVRILLGLLAARGTLDGWELIQMDGMTDSQVGETMRTSAIFLSFSSLEGFGSPPLEAMACGCIVLGFTGGAGKEYLYEPHAHPVSDDDLLVFANAIETITSTWQTNLRVTLDQNESRGNFDSHFALANYSREREIDRLVEIFTDLQAA